MTEPLSETGFLQTKAKLEELLVRRSRIAARDDLEHAHRDEVLRSYDQMIGQYRKELRLYEAGRRSTPEAAGTQ